ncbi:hypothetical protein [Nonomuraea aurantiaca]|uniref:hypothetical protein n=1 Tax=Nonomuraea aurantiaca TaxID=2878562 RepID=UPI001CD942F0|nr:hypothetical protein [Nonomuraea aurantiaca]MCA2229608.1 hypothetical protein [Nonomuraea aurantiaca]
MSQPIENPYPNGLLTGTYSEGPGLASRPDKHAGVTRQGECGRVPIDVVQSTTGAPPHTLGHFGFDLLTGRTCDQLPSAQVAAVFDGYGIASPGLPATLVISGRRLQLEEAAVYTALTSNRVDVSSQTFHRIPYGASLHSRQSAVRSPGRPSGYVLDDGRLWPVTDDRLFTLNGSWAKYLALQQYDSYQKGPTLRPA